VVGEGSFDSEVSFAPHAASATRRGQKRCIVEQHTPRGVEASDERALCGPRVTWGSDAEGIVATVHDRSVVRTRHRPTLPLPSRAVRPFASKTPSLASRGHAMAPRAMGPRALALCASLVALGLGGCGARERCVVGACPEGTVCELDGTCRVLDDSEASRFARARRLHAVDWASSTPHTRARDAMPVGDGDAAYFAFEVPEGELVRAVLTVHLAPVPTAPTPVEVRAFLASTLDGERADRGAPPRRVGPIEVGRVEVPRAGAPLHVDVTSAVARGIGAERRVSLGVVLDGPARSLASPRAVDETLRPRLDVRLR